MEKEEFISKLHEALLENMNEGAAMKHVNYYSNYIEEQKQKGIPEREVIENLGNPRLIAKTISDSNVGNEESHNPGSSDEYFGGNPGTSYTKGWSLINHKGSSLTSKLVFWGIIAFILFLIIGIVASTLGVIFLVIRLIIKLIIPIAIAIAIVYLVKSLKK